MRCKRLDDLLPGYLEGDLSPRLNQRVSDHLDACERCRQELAAQQHALRSLDAARRPVSIDLWADFARRLQAAPSPRSSWRRTLWQPGFAVAAAAVVALAVVLPKPTPATRTVAQPAFVRVAGQPPRDADWHGSMSAVLPSVTADTARPARSETVSAVPSSDRPARGEAGTRAARRRRHHSFASPIASRRLPPRSARSRPRTGPRAEPRVVLAENVVDPARPEPMVTLAGDPAHSRAVAEPEQTVTAAGRRPDGAGDPVKVAEGLVSAEQDVATHQMKDELLRLAREVARMGGEAASAGTAAATPGDSAPAERVPAAAPQITGT